MGRRSSASTSELIERAASRTSCSSSRVSRLMSDPGLTEASARSACAATRLRLATSAGSSFGGVLHRAGGAVGGGERGVEVVDRAALAQLGEQRRAAPRAPRRGSAAPRRPPRSPAAGRRSARPGWRRRRARRAASRSTRPESALRLSIELRQVGGGGADVAGRDAAPPGSPCRGCCARSAAAISSLTCRVEASVALRLSTAPPVRSASISAAQLRQRGVDRGRDAGDLLALDEGVHVADERGCRPRRAASSGSARHLRATRLDLRDELPAPPWRRCRCWRPRPRRPRAPRRPPRRASPAPPGRSSAARRGEQRASSAGACLMPLCRAWSGGRRAARRGSRAPSGRARR